MTFFLQIGLVVIALVIFLVAYNGIRQGGSRVYSLEREAVLRRASATMFVGAACLLAVVGWLYYDNPPPILQSAADTEEGIPQIDTGAVEAEAAAPELLLTETPQPGQTQFNQIPVIETVTLTPTLDPNLPTATPTPIIVRAFVIETGGNGLTLRDKPGGEEILILDENEFVTVLQSEGIQEQGGFVWVKVRTFLGDEGWVAEVFLEVEGE
ncbi:MAG: hypothetical protein ACI9EW_003516 [Cellvibrionaceae bacterium]|jgi:hypothetical protein